MPWTITPLSFVIETMKYKSNVIYKVLSSWIIYKWHTIEYNTKFLYFLPEYIQMLISCRLGRLILVCQMFAGSSVAFQRSAWRWKICRCCTPLYNQSVDTHSGLAGVLILVSNYFAVYTVWSSHSLVRRRFEFRVFFVLAEEGAVRKFLQ